MDTNDYNNDDGFRHQGFFMELVIMVDFCRWGNISDPWLLACVPLVDHTPQVI
jgi:hypothetical protein